MLDKSLLFIKLHVADDGHVWYGYANDKPKDSGKNSLQFLLSPFFNTYSNYRIMFSVNNLQLILPIYNYSDIELEICGPNICQTSKERRDPRIVLNKMLGANMSSSIGGFHKLTENEYITYYIKNKFEANKKLSENTFALLETLPIYSILNWLPYLNKEKIANVIAAIVDPRWYISPVHTARGSKLRQYMGLNIHNILNLDSNTKPEDASRNRCESLIQSWYTSVNSIKVDLPEYFLYRIFKTVSSKKGAYYGLLRASQTFLEFIRLLWITTLSRTKEPLFVPEYFFKRHDEIVSFKEHISNHC